MNTKVLIVGAGPAGTACGIQLRKKGIDCMIVDKYTFPRQKLCAGLITRKTKDVLRELLGDEDFEKCLTKSAKNYAADISLYYRNERRLTVQPEEAITLVDRMQFDQFLANCFIHLGGKFLAGNAINDVNLDKNIVSLTSGEIIQFEILIAADGANSSIEQILSKKHSDFRRKSKNSLCLEINVDRADLDIQGVNIYFGIVPDSYAWAFSKGDQVCIGLVQRAGRKFETNKVMLDFCQMLGVQNMNKYPIRGAMIPLDNCRKKLSYRNVFFVGDASGLVDSLTGEGIYFALQGGVYLADSLQRNKPARDYAMSTQMLRSLVRKSAFLQKLLSIKFTANYFFRNVGKHPEYVKFYYDTQIDNVSLESLWGTVMHYRLNKQLKK